MMRAFVLMAAMVATVATGAAGGSGSRTQVVHCDAGDLLVTVGQGTAGVAWTFTRSSGQILLTLDGTGAVLIGPPREILTREELAARFRGPCDLLSLPPAP